MHQKSTPRNEPLFLLWITITGDIWLSIIYVFIKFKYTFTTIIMNYKHYSSVRRFALLIYESTQIARFMGQTWGPPGSCWPQMGPMLAPWTLLSGIYYVASRQLQRDPTPSWDKHADSVYHNTSNHTISRSQYCYLIDVHTHGIEHYFQ